MKKYWLILFLFFIWLSTHAQSPQVISLTPQEAEILFFQNNLQLIAARYDIDIAEAAVIQSKLWDNPTLSIENVSFWSSLSQREGEEELIPPMFGNFGKNTEFSIELSQLIQTAGKRRKLIRREKTAKEIALYEFEDLLRALKLELRQTLNELQYLQSFQEILNQQEKSLSNLIHSYQRQFVQGNFAKSELLRLESSLLELQNEINENRLLLHEQQRTVKSLLNLPAFTTIYISKDEIITTDFPNPESIPLAGLLEKAKESRPDLNSAILQTEYHRKSLAYEKAHRVPDVTLMAVYDRYGGVWKDFFGIGASIDLPVINRNQGNIKAVKAEKEQSIRLAEFYVNLAEHEVMEAYQNYILIYEFYNKISGNNLLSELDDMMEIYTKNFLARNISLLEYIDFMDIYKENKETVLSAEKNLKIYKEELIYAVGTEID